MSAQTVTVPARPEITENYRAMLLCQRRMDWNVPDRGVVFIGDSLTQGLCTEVLCSNEPRCVFADAGPGLVDGEGNLKGSLQDGDGIHLNAEGNAIWIGVLKTAVTTAQMRATGRL